MYISPRFDSCSALARANDEPLYGTAPTSPAWLLLEQPGSWAADPMASTGLSDELAGELTMLSKQVGFRTLLLRRSAARTYRNERLCFLVRSTQTGPWMRRLTLERTAELLDVDLSVLGSDEPPVLGEQCQPLYTVCTHGRRDPCCAEHGRRLMRRLGAAGDPSLQECLWESSHQGGHRFAANLACFPQGVFYGRVEADEVIELLSSHGKGLLSLDHYRGRSALSRVAQAADYFLRSESGLRHFDDLPMVAERQVGDDTFRVEFAAPGGGRRQVQVHTSEGPARPESCNKHKLTPLIRYEMRSLDG